MIFLSANKSITSILNPFSSTATDTLHYHHESKDSFPDRHDKGYHGPSRPISKSFSIGEAQQAHPERCGRIKGPLGNASDRWSPRVCLCVCDQNPLAVGSYVPPPSSRVCRIDQAGVRRFRSPDKRTGAGMAVDDGSERSD
jgi:hypothetical protein